MTRTATKGGPWGGHVNTRQARTAGSAALAGIATAALLALSAAPGAAATPVAQASASAVTLTVGGQTTDTGAYESTHDGTAEHTSGSRTPALTVLGGQSLISAGTLAQDATTSVVDSQGHSAACAGLAGPGATVAAVGDAGSCLTGGQAVSLDPGSLDLSGLQLVSSGLFQGLDATLVSALQPVLQPLTAALQQGLTTAVTQLGLGLDVGLGAVTSSCVGGPGTASGSAHLADAGATLTVGGQQVHLVDLPADPAPNTHVVTGLGSVATTIENALSAQLNTLLGNQLSTLLPGLPTPPTVSAADQATILNNALGQVGAALAPLQDNLLDITLNSQSKASADQITVTALDMRVLPAAQQFGIDSFDLKVGTSTCGPSGRVAASPSASASPTVEATHQAKPRPRPHAVPTAVPAGAATATSGAGPDGRGLGGVLALGGLLAVAVGGAGAAWTSVRRPQ